MKMSVKDELIRYLVFYRVSDINNLNFEQIYLYFIISQDFVSEFKTIIPKHVLSKIEVSCKFIEENISLYDLPTIFKHQKLSESFLKNYINNPLYLNYILQYQNISFEFIKNEINYKDRSIFNALLIWGKLPELFIEENIDLIDNFDYVFLYQRHLSKEFILKYKDKIKWRPYIFEVHQIPIELLNEYKLIFSPFWWDKICLYQTLSETFIRQNKNKLNWLYISEYQKFSLRFAWLMKDRIDINLLMRNNNLSRNFKKRYKKMIDDMYKKKLSTHI